MVCTAIVSSVEKGFYLERMVSCLYFGGFLPLFWGISRPENYILMHLWLRDLCRTDFLFNFISL